ncbi:MAG: hypothetical protein RML95_03200 [Anaerolineae bacterium]|nr:hypothetical protein [Anaerolineae bacterium]
MTRRLWLPFAFLTLLIGSLAALFIGNALRATGLDVPVLPLDDAYIHFQYARALAEGHPFRYNPDQPPTSGATSLLYPFLLAVGYLFGFTGESLAHWALGIGILTWLGATWLVFRLVHSEGERLSALALGMAAIFAMHGSLAWAFVSGMETGLFIYAMLLTLWHVRSGKIRAALLASALTALVRPEGAVIAVSTALYLFLKQPARRADILYYALPFAASAAQPLLNLALTGSLSGSGMQAKSYLYNVPSDPEQTLWLIGDTFARLWRELFTDISAYNTAFFAVLALFPILFVTWQLIVHRKLSLPLLIAAWLLGLSGIAALVETAFWQFKRYQQPIIALIMLLSGYTFVALSRSRQHKAAYFLIGAYAVYALIGLRHWSAHYVENVREVALSQRKLAHAVAQLPSEAVVGAHDIGMVRYLGNRTTYDVVGLTTPDAAEAWRHGSGVVFEQMYASQWRPDHFAIYPDARGLTYFAQSGVFGEVLGSFPSTKPTINVASATNSGQFLYRADWRYATYAAQPMQPSTLAAVKDFVLVDSLNVAHLASERAHNYRWWQALRRYGFPSELHTLTYHACAPPDMLNTACHVTDGGRLLTGGEQFKIRTQAGRDLLWIMRVQAQYPISLRLYADGQPIGTRVVPEIKGKWIEIASLVPRELITGESLTLRVEVDGVADYGFYLPYHHWFYQGDYQREELNSIVATFADSVALNAADVAYNAAARTLTLDLTWSLLAESPFDAVVFMHIYDQSGKLLESAQRDVRVGAGALPPANWLPDRAYRERHVLELPDDLPRGEYRVAVGLYDPRTLTRHAARSALADAEQRVFIGAFDINQ